MRPHVGSGYWSSDAWDPDNRVYAGAEIYQTHRLAVQEDEPQLHKPESKEQPKIARLSHMTGPMTWFKICVIWSAFLLLYALFVIVDRVVSMPQAAPFFAERFCLFAQIATYVLHSPLQSLLPQYWVVLAKTGPNSVSYCKPTWAFKKRYKYRLLAPCKKRAVSLNSTLVRLMPPDDTCNKTPPQTPTRGAGTAQLTGGPWTIKRRSLS